MLINRQGIAPDSYQLFYRHGLFYSLINVNQFYSIGQR